MSHSEQAMMFSILPNFLRQDIIDGLEKEIEKPWDQEFDSPKKCCGRTGRQHLEDRLAEFKEIDAGLRNLEDEQTTPGSEHPSDDFGFSFMVVEIPPELLADIVLLSPSGSGPSPFAPFDGRGIRFQ
jgi:hypothetical protein